MAGAFQTGAGTPIAPHGLPGHLVGFVESLRRRGIAVGPSETVDAGRVMTVIDLLDREALREGLACTVLRRTTHRPTFDALFDLWFPPAIGHRTADAPDADLPRTPDGDIDLDALRELLAELLADDSAEAQAAVEALTAQMVEELGQYKSSNGPSFSAYQALREVAPETLLTRILEGLLGNSAPDARADGDYETEVARRTAARRIADFRAMVERETRRRTAEHLGRERVEKYGVPKLAEEVDFLRASDADMVALRRSVMPLARLLASRLAARRRRSRAGAIDLRRTLRKSMSTGGVPIDLINRKPRPARPELVVLCDVSGSVSGFSHFTLLLVHALREQFSRVRVFAFIDTTDEVTHYFSSGADLGDAMSRMLREADLITYDGHSDYGNALATFAERHAHSLTGRSSLLILGDARTNYRNPNLDVLEHLVGVARHAHWLNPEPRGQWGSGDSAARAYAEVITMHECRSAQQLAAVVAGLLPV
ncbi:MULTISPECIES: vWA domain-containing protein [unclassified Rhodococcus (in: high G+C Gram-positive bacteria)]|uniref:vWA domain-containing protein n=1 Tax=unclassified Rhodococcus (in: high G+C Gram-positive bacteria) TaxID=192944 RepID=UPI00146CDE06|nr:MULTISPECIES: VWA domain-containing protein [unclassified Rhodococcus (in: high G+C Gram-positive bacteria)]MBF0660260.1 VWA domain-containing protein [Rhodococcus sp. (in: high G+C Gram-positive bacteria)]NMD95064.1 VWA domain-containing protein [Rhodococcus sp. BL-253-APC-6A1W]NME78574.1 VWA domain-containing protein [Rhodococcus sp. 105337]